MNICVHMITFGGPNESVVALFVLVFLVGCTLSSLSCLLCNFLEVGSCTLGFDVHF